MLLRAPRSASICVNELNASERVTFSGNGQVRTLALIHEIFKAFKEVEAVLYQRTAEIQTGRCVLNPIIWPLRIRVSGNGSLRL